MKGGGSREVSSSSPVRPAQVRKTQTLWASAKDRVPYVKCEAPHIFHRVTGREVWPCGQCPSCRMSHVRMWTHRIMLEASLNAENLFVTATYKPECCPGELSVPHFQGWIKRLRYFVDQWGEQRKIRYFGCGEYGDATGRPHYHAAVFGIGCGLGPIRVGGDGSSQCWCRACQAIRSSWSFGHTMVGSLEQRSAAYIAGYVLKKMKDTSGTTYSVPPFTRMSLRPGIGAGAMRGVATSITPRILERMNNDVPVGLRIGRLVWPLGRYLRNHLRELVELDEGCPEHVVKELQERVSVVFEYADAVAKDNPRLWRVAVKQAFEEVNGQLNRNVAARNIKRGSL